MRQQETKLEKLLKMGKAIAQQTNYALLFHYVVQESITFLNSEGGTLYLFDVDKHCLTAVVALNKVLKIDHTIDEFDPAKIEGLFSIELDKKNAGKMQASIAGECWRQKKLVVVPNTDEDTDFDLQSLRKFDKEYGYKSRSIVAMPLLTRDDRVIGVVQLVNPAIDLKDSEDVEMIATIIGLMGLSMENKLLLISNEIFLKSVIEMVSSAIDARSKTTGGHCHRVTELTMMLAQAMVDDTTGPYRDFNLAPEELDELRVAALLHDVGKIATPDHVLEKARKLEKTFDKIEYLRLRSKLRQQQLHVERLEDSLRDSGVEVPEQAPNEKEEDDFKFIEALNIGGEFLDKVAEERLQQIAHRETPDGPLIEETDLYDLLVKRGTLNPEERKVMENHASISIRLLEKLPWPATLAQVTEIAGSHHENCDGSGYPRGIMGKDMSLCAKVLSLTDRFEGLSAIDRSYRKPKSMEQVMAIMADMSSKNQVDPELFDFFVERGVHTQYAQKFLRKEDTEKKEDSAAA